MPGLSLLQVFCITLAASLLAAGAWFFRKNTADPPSFSLLIVLGLLIRGAFAVFTPAWEAPDERAHFAYIRFLAENHRLPEQTARVGDESGEWEYHQPPLYYLLMAGPYLCLKAMGFQETGMLHGLRFAGLWFWIGQMAALRLALRQWQASAATEAMTLAVWAFLPSAVFLSAMVNNDQAALLAALLLAGLTPKLVFNRRAAVAAGGWLALGLYAKLSLAGFPVYLIAVGWRMRRQGLRVWVHVAAALSLAALLWAPWAIRNQQLYGNFFAEGVAFSPAHWPGGLLQAGTETALFLMHSFWAGAGVFQQIGFPFWIAGMGAAVGLALWPANKPGSIGYPGETLFTVCWAGWVALGFQLVLTLRIGLLYAQAQGRFLYPFLWVVGLWLASKAGRFGVSPRSFIGAAWVYAVAFAAFALAMMTRIPGWTPT